MSSEALERLRQAQFDAGEHTGLTEVYAADIAALLAEVARLEQECDEAQDLLAESERSATSQFIRLEDEVRRQEAALAVAREREQRLREALQEALNCKGPFNGKVSQYGGYPAICTRCAERARAALQKEHVVGCSVKTSGREGE